MVRNVHVGSKCPCGDGRPRPSGRAKLGSLEHSTLPRPFPDFSSGPRRCPRLQLRGSAGFAPASLSLCVRRTPRRTRTRERIESTTNVHGADGGCQFREDKSENNPNRPEILRHLQDFAANLCFLLACKSLFAQQFADQSQGINFFLEAFEFGFFASEYFHGVLHIGRAAGDVAAHQ